MSRIVSVWLPDWPIDRLRRMAPALVPEKHPFALVEKGPHGLCIHAVNAAAYAAGIRPGRPLADVRASHPSLVVRPATQAEDAQALGGLARWLGRYSPRRNEDGADGAWIDITGAAHLQGGEAALLRDIIQRLAGLGIAARVGLADTFGAAHALARWATSSREPMASAPPGGSRTALAPLPVSSLRLAPVTAELLGRLGLKRIGLLYGVPRTALERRFREVPGARRGPGESMRNGSRPAPGRAAAAAAVLLRLDQALGGVAEPKAPLAEPPATSARLAFAEPLISHAGIIAAVESLAASLCRDLAGRCLGAARFRLSLYRSDGTLAEVGIGTSVPSRDPSHICRLLAEKLADLDASFGLDLLTLDAERTEVLVSQQSALAAAPERPDVALLLDRLVNRLGAGRIVRPATAESHLPELAEKFLPAHAATVQAARSAASVPVASRRLPRPALLIAPPEPASVVAEIPDGAPVRLVWRRLSRRIARAEGPERIAPEWWRSLAVSEASRPGTRDYYRLEDDSGAGFWVFREGLYGEYEDRLPRWFVHGVWT